MMDLTKYRIESYYDNYACLCSEEQKASFIKRGFTPGKLFVKCAEGVLFKWWPLGAEDMETEIIPHGVSVLCKPEWVTELKELGVECYINTITLA